jgi:branched-subunit amino acid transport protein
VTGAWVLVAVVGVATIALKAAGPVLVGGRELPPRLVGVVALLAPTLLAALVVTQTLADGRTLTVDARAAGVAAGAVAVALRAPVLAVVAVAAVVAALVRLAS